MFVFFDQRLGRYVVSGMKPEETNVTVYCGTTGARIEGTGFTSRTDDEIEGFFRKERNSMGLDELTLVEVGTEKYQLEQAQLFYSWVEDEILWDSWDPEKREYPHRYVPRRTFLGTIE